MTMLTCMMMNDRADFYFGLGYLIVWYLDNIEGILVILELYIASSFSMALFCSTNEKLIVQKTIVK